MSTWPFGGRCLYGKGEDSPSIKSFELEHEEVKFK